MQGDEIHPEDPRPDRVAEVRSSERRGRLLELLVDRLEDRPPADARPARAEAVVLEDELPVAAVVSHDEVGLRVPDRPVMRAADEALQLAPALADGVRDAAVGVDQVGRPRVAH